MENTEKVVTVETACGPATVEKDSKREYLIVQIPFAVTALIQKAGCSDAKRFDQVLWLMEKAGIPREQAEKAFEKAPLFSQKEKTEAVADKTDQAFAKILAKVEKDIAAFEKKAGAKVTAEQMRGAIAKMNHTDEVKEQLRQAFKIAPTELIF